MKFLEAARYLPAGTSLDDGERVPTAGQLVEVLRYFEGRRQRHGSAGTPEPKSSS